MSDRLDEDRHLERLETPGIYCYKGPPSRENAIRGTKKMIRSEKSGNKKSRK